MVTGGQQFSGESSIPLDSTEILETNTWRISAPLPSARYGLKAASLGNTIFLFGEKMFRMNLYFNYNLFRRTWWIIWTKHSPEIRCHQPYLGEGGGDGGEEIWPYCFPDGGCIQALWFVSKLIVKVIQCFNVLMYSHSILITINIKHSHLYHDFLFDIISLKSVKDCPTNWTIAIK